MSLDAGTEHMNAEQYRRYVRGEMSREEIARIRSRGDSQAALDIYVEDRRTRQGD